MSDATEIEEDDFFNYAQKQGEDLFKSLKDQQIGFQDPESEREK